MLVLFLCGILLLLFHIRAVQKHIAIEKEMSREMLQYDSVSHFLNEQLMLMVEDRDLYILFLENEPRSKK